MLSVRNSVGKHSPPVGGNPRISFSVLKLRVSCGLLAKDALPTVPVV